MTHSYLVDLTDKMPTHNFLLLLVLKLRNVLTPVLILNLKFGYNIEAEVLLRFWSIFLVKTLRLRFGHDFDAEVWSRFWGRSDTKNGADQAPTGSGIFNPRILQNPGIPGFFGTGLAWNFCPRILPKKSKISRESLLSTYIWSISYIWTTYYLFVKYIRQTV